MLGAVSIGDHVKSRINFTGEYGRVKRDDIGIVQGPSEDHLRVNVKFPKHANVDILVEHVKQVFEEQEKTSKATPQELATIVPKEFPCLELERTEMPSRECQGICLFDYDGTGANDKKKTLEAIQCCEAKGYKVGVLTFNPGVTWGTWDVMCDPQGRTCKVERRFWFHKCANGQTMNSDQSHRYIGSSSEDRRAAVNGKVAVLEWVHTQHPECNPKKIVLWDDNKANQDAVSSSKYSIIRVGHGIQKEDTEFFKHDEFLDHETRDHDMRVARNLAGMGINAESEGYVPGRPWPPLAAASPAPADATSGAGALRSEIAVASATGVVQRMKQPAKVQVGREIQTAQQLQELLTKAMAKNEVIDELSFEVGCKADFSLEGLLDMMDSCNDNSPFVHLQRLQLFNNRIVCGTIECLSIFQHLELCNIADCPKLTGDIGVFGKCKGLAFFHVNGCANVTGDIGTLAACTKLKQLNVTGCTHVTGDVQSLALLNPRVDVRKTNVTNQDVLESNGHGHFK